MNTGILDLLETASLDLPVNWEQVRLKYLAKFENSGAYGAEQGESKYDLPVCTTAHITRGGKLLIKDMPIRSFDENETNRYTGKAGDIFVVKSSGSNTNIISGKLALIDSQTPDVVFSNFLMRITPNKKKCSPRFLAYFLDSGITKERIRKMVATTTYPNINVEEYSSELIPVPPLETQTKISNYLDRKTAELDQLIGAKQRLLKLLDEKKCALIARAVTRGLNPNVPLKESGIPWLGKIPAHWEKTIVKRLFKFAKRQDYPDLEVLSVYREYGVIIKSSRNDNNNRTPEDLTKYQLVEPGDLVINKMKAWQGSMGISKYTGITSPDYVVYEKNHNENGDFLHYLFRAPFMPNVYQMFSNGIRLSQWRLEPEHFENLIFFLPPVEEQGAIVAVVKKQLGKLDDLKSITEKTIAFLQERRTALISAAVTGQLEEASQ